MSQPDFLGRNLERLIPRLPRSADDGRLLHLAREAIGRGYRIRSRRTWLLRAVTTAAALVLGLLTHAATGSRLPSLPEGRVHLPAGDSGLVTDGVRVSAVAPTWLRLEPHEGNVLAQFETGDAVFDVAPGAPRLSVRTLHGAVSGRGTTFQARSIPMSRAEVLRQAVLSVAVFAGTVLFLSPSGGEVHLRAGEILIAAPDGTTERLTLAETSERLQRLRVLEQAGPNPPALLHPGEPAVGKASDSAPQEGSPSGEPDATEPTSTLAAGLDAIDWDRLAPALLSSARAMREGRPPGAEVYGELGGLLMALAALRGDLGGESLNDWLAHPQVQGRLAAAIAKALAPQLSDEDRVSLRSDITRHAEAALRELPAAVPPIARIGYELDAAQRARSILARYIGAQLAAETEGLSLGAMGDLRYDSRYVLAPDEDVMVKAMLSYWGESVRLEPSQVAIATAIARSWADEFAATRMRAIREFGLETARAAFTAPPDGASADAGTAVREESGFAARLATIIEWVFAVQVRHESTFYENLTEAQRTEYEDAVPALLVFWAES